MAKSYKPRIRRETPAPVPTPLPVLARVGDPFIAPDGSICPPLYPEDYFPRVKEDTRINPITFRGKRRRNVDELPAAAHVMTAVGAVMLYTMFGIGDREIATALKCTVLDVEEIRAHPAYGEYLELLGSEIISAESDNLTHRLAAYAHGALDTIAHVSRNGKLENNRLRASIDIMDRGGFAPKAVAEKQVSLKNVLRIQVMDDNGKGRDMDISLSSTIEESDDGDRSEQG